MQQIIPSHHQSHVLDALTKQPLEYFMREGEVRGHTSHNSHS